MVELDRNVSIRWEKTGDENWCWWYQPEVCWEKSEHRPITVEEFGIGKEIRWERNKSEWFKDFPDIKVVKWNELWAPKTWEEVENER